MKLARVVGNVVSTVKDACYTGQKLMIIDYIDENGSLTGNQAIAFDVADAGIGDTVLVNVEGGSANMLRHRRSDDLRCHRSHHARRRDPGIPLR